jgi:hypothetical protein
VTTLKKPSKAKEKEMPPKPEARDAAKDKKRGIKEDSKRDVKMDSAAMINLRTAVMGRKRGKR